MADKKLHWPKEFTGLLHIGGKAVTRPDKGILNVAAEDVAAVPLNLFGLGFYWLPDAPESEDKPVKK